MPEKKYNNKINIKGISLTSLGWELAFPIFGGTLLGYYIDRTYFTNHTFTIILMLGGLLVGYYNIYRNIELEILRNKATKRKVEER